MLQYKLVFIYGLMRQQNYKQHTAKKHKQKLVLIIGGYESKRDLFIAIIFFAG